MPNITLLFSTFILCLDVFSQTFNPITISSAIQIAKEKSSAIRGILSTYYQAELEYKNHKANYKPNLAMALTPGRYNHSIVQRYLSSEDQDVYRTQETLYSSSQLTLTQKVGFTGGDLFLYSEIGAYKTFGSNGYTQFTTIPIGLGYSQQLIGYNAYKWNKRIEEIRFEQAQQQLAYATEGLSAKVSDLFIAALFEQKQLELSKEALAISDTLLKQGYVLEKIGRLTKSSLLLLQFEKSKSEKSLLESESRSKIALRELGEYIGLPNQDEYILNAPQLPTPIGMDEKDISAYSALRNPINKQLSLATLSAQQILDKAQKQRYAETSFELTVGFNQTGRTFSQAYSRPLRQDIVSIGLNIPLIDWGIRKRTVAKAKEAVFVAKLNEEEATKQLQRESATLLSSYRLHLKMASLAKDNIAIARKLRQESHERFLLGKESLELLLRANQNVQESEQDYIVALKDCWNSYFKLRQHMLYDWEKGVPISGNE